MANAKNKSYYKNSNNKKNNRSVNLNKKVHNTKKKVIIPDEVKKEIKEGELIKKPTKKKPSTKGVKVNNTVIYKNNISNISHQEIALERKERNRKKYENKQKKYHDNVKAKVKKKVEIPDEVKKEEKNINKEEKLVKKRKTKEFDSESKIKEKERKERRKENRKGVHFTQTLVNIKNKSVDKINIVKEKVNDKSIPTGESEEEKKHRFSRIIKESIIYAILLTIIDVLCILFLDYFDFLRLFDVKALNIVVTVIVSLIFNFFIAFMIDHFTTKIWLKRKLKKKVDDVNGDNRINEGEYQENIENKEGE